MIYEAPASYGRLVLLKWDDTDRNEVLRTWTRVTVDRVQGCHVRKGSGKIQERKSVWWSQVEIATLCLESSSRAGFGECVRFRLRQDSKCHVYLARLWTTSGIWLVSRSVKRSGSSKKVSWTAVGPFLRALGNYLQCSRRLSLVWSVTARESARPLCS